VIQFLIETVTLAQLGGFIGIVLGVVVGNVFGSMMGMDLTIPVLWIVFSVAICTLLGVVFGVYPAFKAAKLDPIDALRYE
jgi:putative ABC transport system permease protein